MAQLPQGGEGLIWSPGERRP